VADDNEVRCLAAAVWKRRVSVNDAWLSSRPFSPQRAIRRKHPSVAALSASAFAAARLSPSRFALRWVRRRDNRRVSCAQRLASAFAASPLRRDNRRLACQP